MTLHVALLGCGHMGSLHARTVAADPESRLVAVIDPRKDRARELASQFGAEVRDAVPEGADVVIVATPTPTHAALARVQADAGRWVLVEKPFTASEVEAAGLQHTHIVVGHVERFNPAVRTAGVLRPAFIDARRCVPWSGRSAEISVVGDLMVHDLDLLLGWCEGEVADVQAQGVTVRSADVDVATVRITTTDGLVAQLHASRVADSPERTVRAYEPTATVRLDLLTGRAWRDTTEIPCHDPRDGLTAQWQALVAAVLGRAPVAVDSRDGWRSVALAERILACMLPPTSAVPLRAGSAR